MLSPFRGQPVPTSRLRLILCGFQTKSRARILLNCWHSGVRMFSKPFLVAALAIACVTAAGAGAYIAVRQNHDVEPASAANQSADTTNPAKPANPAVPETEAVISPPL